MINSQFYTTEQANAFVRYGFPSIKLPVKWSRPQFMIHAATGFGSFEGREQHQLQFETMDKGYHELGLLINGLWTPSFYSFGIGGFYRLGHYADTDWKKNIVPKLSLRINLN